MTFFHRYVEAFKMPSLVQFTVPYTVHIFLKQDAQTPQIYLNLEINTMDVNSTQKHPTGIDPLSGSSTSSTIMLRSTSCFRIISSLHAVCKQTNFFSAFLLRQVDPIHFGRRSRRYEKCSALVVHTICGWMRREFFIGTVHGFR